MESKTFILQSEARHPYPSSNFESKPMRRRCSYCTNIAKAKDIGDRQHEWEYYCDCETATKEIELKKNMSELRNKLYYMEKDLEKVQAMEDNPETNYLKYKDEKELLKKRYKIEDKYE